jgi:hypothetical protein
VYKHALFETLLNEVITLYIHVEDVKDEVGEDILTIRLQSMKRSHIFGKFSQSPLKKRFTLNAPLKKVLSTSKMFPE